MFEHPDSNFPRILIETATHLRTILISKKTITNQSNKAIQITNKKTFFLISLHRQTTWNKTTTIYTQLKGKLTREEEYRKYC